jgi:tetratricopeptide (TPR) repeat protein
MFCRTKHVIVLILLLFNPLQAQQFNTPSNDSLIQQAIEMSIQHNYYNAEKIVQQIIENHPEHPAGYFFMAATIQSKMMDFETNRWDADFFHYIKLTIKKANNKIHKSPDKNIWAQFYKGSALSYLAFVEGRRGKYLQAIRHGFSGVALLKKIAKVEPNFHDALFGIGSYSYWRSRITRFINWLPIISDQREAGIQMITQATKKGRFTRYAALNELIWILIDASKPDEAFEYAQKGLKKFPESRFFLWGAAKSAAAQKKYPDAIYYFEKIIESITQADFNNHYNEYICRLNLIKCYLETDNIAVAKNQLSILKALKIEPIVQKRLKKQKKRLKEFEKLIGS